MSTLVAVSLAVSPLRSVQLPQSLSLVLPAQVRSADLVQAR